MLSGESWGCHNYWRLSMTSFCVTRCWLLDKLRFCLTERWRLWATWTCMTDLRVMLVEHDRLTYILPDPDTFAVDNSCCKTTPGAPRTSATPRMIRTSCSTTTVTTACIARKNCFTVNLWCRKWNTELLVLLHLHRALEFQVCFSLWEMRAWQIFSVMCNKLVMHNLQNHHSETLFSCDSMSTENMNSTSSGQNSSGILRKYSPSPYQNGNLCCCFVVTNQICLAGSAWRYFPSLFGYAEG